MHALLTGLLAAVTLLQGPAVCAADSLCPETVSVKQTALAPAPEWSLSYSTTLELSKALAPTVSSCRVTYDRQTKSSVGLPAIKRIVCQ